MKLSIKKRIYWSFTLLVSLFVINGVISIVTLNENGKLSRHISTVIDPSLQALEDFQDMLVESKMLSTDWVFSRSDDEDKSALQKLHSADYPALKMKLKSVFATSKDEFIKDSLNKAFKGFERLIGTEKKIMSSLQRFEDYNDPVAKLEAERIIKNEVIPQTSGLMNTLTGVVFYEKSYRLKENTLLANSFMRLATLITVLAITIICIGIFLSLYFTKVIISPINKIKNIVNHLGKGMLQKLDDKGGNDEMGEMIRSVNHLSEKLQGTAAFAIEIGNRNFHSYFEPLSEEDTLGNALVAMRDSIKLSDQKLNDAQHIASIGSWERDIATDRFTMSDEMFNILEIDPPSFDFKFQSFLRFIHPEDVEYVASTIQKNLYLPPVPFEFRITTSKGVSKNIRVESKLKLGKYGEVEKSFGILQDITEQENAKKQLQSAHDHLFFHLENSPMAFVEWDNQIRPISWSKRAEEIFGWTESDATSGELNWLSKVYEEDLPMASKIAEQLLNGSVAKNQVQHRNYTKNGRVIWCEWFNSVLRDNDGKVITILSLIQDITERKNAEAELYKSEERYRQIVETAQEGIWMIDENNNTTFINKKMCEIIGYTAEELSGKRIHDFMDQETNKNAVEQIERRKNGISETHDSVFITKSGRAVWTSLSTNPVFDDAGIYKGALAMVTDITARKQDEALLQKSQSSLEMNNRILEQKNKELEQFAYVASHDLQEPLSTTISFVELFKKQYFEKLDPKADKYLTYIVQASDRMKVLIKDLLDFSRIGHSKQIEKADCNIILQQVVPDIDKAIKDSGAQIIAEDLPVVRGYSTELKQLFQNLIINSIKFRKDNVLPKINITAKRKNDYLEFAFSDNGIGIDQQHNERIFIIFQRLHTRSQYQGSGIGLSHCKKIVELHHGKIWVESTPNNGSTFYFTIYSPKDTIYEPKTKLHNAH